MSFDRAEITVTGKGSKTRIIPMLEPVKRIMKHHRKDIGRVFDELHPDTVSHRFQEIAEGAGVKARLHDLRHTSVTYMLNSGARLEVVQKIAGHASISTTMIYSHVVEDMKKREMAKLNFKTL